MATKPNTTGEAPTSQSATETPAPATLSPAPLTLSAAILIAVDDTLAKDNAGKREGWTAKLHARTIVRVALALGLPRDQAKTFAALLEEKGLGGNASQFRQWLETPAPKGPGRLDKPADKAASLAADF